MEMEEEVSGYRRPCCIQWGNCAALKLKGRSLATAGLRVGFISSAEILFK
jgi:hypothetical protein